MKDLLKASLELYGNGSMTPPSTDIYISGTLATSEQMTAIIAKATELEKEWNATQFQRDRTYPELGEQLDLLFHDMTAGKGTKDGEWYKAVSKVKTDNPKP